MINNSRLIVCGVNYCSSLYIHNLLRTEFAKSRKIIYDKNGNLTKMINTFKDVKKFKEPKNSLLLFEAIASIKEPTVLVISGLDKCHTHVLQFLQDIVNAKAKLRHEVVLIATIPSLDHSKTRKQIDASGVFSEWLKIHSDSGKFVLQDLNNESKKEIFPLSELRNEYLEVKKKLENA